MTLRRTFAELGSSGAGVEELAVRFERSEPVFVQSTVLFPFGTPVELMVSSDESSKRTITVRGTVSFTPSPRTGRSGFWAVFPPQPMLPEIIAALRAAGQSAPTLVDLFSKA